MVTRRSCEYVTEVFKFGSRKLFGNLTTRIETIRRWKYVDVTTTTFEDVLENGRM